MTSSIRPTDEQQAAIDLAGSGETFVLDAPAGSGKSSTAREMAKVIDGRVLYLVYNKAAKNDAQGTFPANTTVQTTSALAYHRYKAKYGHRMYGVRVTAAQTAKIAGINQPLHLGGNIPPIRPNLIARWALETIDRFCYSADAKILDKHVPTSSLPVNLDQIHIDFLKSEIRKWAEEIWTQALNPSSPHKFDNNYAFKLMVMEDPQFGYDAVIVDEAQDSNMATHRLVSNQMSQLIIIGDPAQQLYSWRGAVDIMNKFEGPRLQLTQSFRFGEAVAAEAEKWLAHTGTGIHIKGLPSAESKVVDFGLVDCDAVLCRTNAKAMATAMQYLDEGRTVAIEGGTSALSELAFAAIDLRAGKPTSHPELATFTSWGELVEFTEEPGGGDLKALVQLIQKYGSKEIIAACSQIVPESPEAAKSRRKAFTPPDVIVSTAHKSKGREWMRVKVADDFTEPEDVTNPITGESSPGPITYADAMLHYVTVTRARKVLDRGGLAWIDRHDVAKKV